jgi:hypothetical protein
MKSYFVTGLVVVLALAGYHFLSGENNRTLGSVGNEGIYNYQIATSTYASASTAKLIKTGQGVIGSVIVASSSASTFTLQNNASTTSTSTAKMIFHLPVNATPGTYTIDAAFTEGLTADVPDTFNGAYTITWR